MAKKVVQQKALTTVEIVSTHTTGTKRIGKVICLCADVSLASGVSF